MINSGRDFHQVFQPRPAVSDILVLYRLCIRYTAVAVLYTAMVGFRLCGAAKRFVITESSTMASFNVP